MQQQNDDWTCNSEDFWELMHGGAVNYENDAGWDVPKCDFCARIFPESMPQPVATWAISHQTKDCMFNFCSACLNGHTYFSKWQYLVNLQENGRFPNDDSPENVSIFGLYFEICDPYVYHGRQNGPHNVHHLTEMGKAALFPASGVKKAISQ